MWEEGDMDVGPGVREERAGKDDGRQQIRNV
jgi:hypothetical protein